MNPSANDVKLNLIIMLIWCLTCVGWYQHGYRNGRLDSLPTQSEIQEAIGVEVDGVIGAESRRVWDEVIEQRETDEWIMPIMEKFMKEYDRKYLNGMEFD